MLGNDVVDLKKALLESNWRRRGYLDKLFSTSEKEVIFSSTIPDTTVWLFWSMKEAAYKIVNRQMGQRFYAPKKFLCKLVQTQDHLAIGEVQFGEHVFFTRSIIDTNSIHSIALVDDNGFKDLKVCSLPNTEDYVSVFNTASTAYSLGKDVNGLPQLTNKQTNEITPASISHHGDYLKMVHILRKS